MHVTVAAARRRLRAQLGVTTNVLPSTLVVGPRKTGTTWIYTLLAARSDVRVPRRVKETFYFDKFFTGHMDDYARHFTGNILLPAVDIAPSYFASDFVISRVRSAMPNLSIVVVLRDPVDRLVSHYGHLRRYGQTRLPFRQAVAAHSDLVEQSRYCKWIAAWQASYPSRVHLLGYGLLRNCPAEFGRAVCKIVGCKSDEVLPATLPAEARNQRDMPRSVWLAGLAGRLSLAAKRRGLHGAVDFAKRLGLKQLALSGGRTHEFDVSVQERHALAEIFAAEYKQFCDYF